MVQKLNVLFHGIGHCGNWSRSTPWFLEAYRDPTELLIPWQTESCCGLGPAANCSRAVTLFLRQAMVWENDCYPKKFLILRQAGPCGKSQFLGRITGFMVLWQTELGGNFGTAAGHSFRKNDGFLTYRHCGKCWVISRGLTPYTTWNSLREAWLGDNNYSFESVAYALCFSILARLQ